MSSSWTCWAATHPRPAPRLSTGPPPPAMGAYGSPTTSSRSKPTRGSAASRVRAVVTVASGSPRISLTSGSASLLSVDAGLLGLLTGRENSVLLGVLVGLSRTESGRALDRVKSRSGLGDAFERPVSSYSQGMRARLGYAVAERVDPEVLLLDEVHEALDHEFRDIIEGAAHQIKEAGGIVVAAGHDHPMLARLCPRALLMRSGRIEADGDFGEVTHAYVG